MSEAFTIWRQRRPGNTTALAKSLGITSQAVSQWRRVPAERVREVARFTEIPQSELRPDLYPREEAA